MDKFKFIILRMTLLYCGLLANAALTAQLQSRFPLQPSSSWRVDSIDAFWNIAENTRYFIHGDTTIKSRKYFKLYKSGNIFLDVPFTYINYYYGAIRDEMSKTFFVKKNKTDETLLFDYNLNIGDTVKSSIGNGKIIQSIDTLQNGRRLFYYVKSKFQLGYFIEGIGSNGGLFSIGSAYVFIHSGEKANYLICYSENGKVVFSPGYKGVPKEFYSSIGIISKNNAASDSIYLQITTFQQLLVNSEINPPLTNFSYTREKSDIYINLYYFRNNKIEKDDELFPCAVTDTISLGQLLKGAYTLHCTIHTILGPPNSDTIFNDLSFWGRINYQPSAISLSPDKNVLHGILIYPVPAKDKVFVEWTGDIKGLHSIEVLNFVGKKILSVDHENLFTGSCKYELNTSSLKSGIYFLFIKKGNSFIMQKIILE
jgi:hypothetical protein